MASVSTISPNALSMFIYGFTILTATFVYLQIPIYSVFILFLSLFKILRCDN